MTDDVDVQHVTVPARVYVASIVSIVVALITAGGIFYQIDSDSKTRLFNVIEDRRKEYEDKLEKLEDRIPPPEVKLQLKLLDERIRDLNDKIDRIGC